jgi:hypothetical protein
MEINPDDLWVANRLATIEPQWHSELTHGRELLDARLAKHSHVPVWMAAAAATAAVCIAMIALPGTRVLAQELWYRLVLHRVDVMRLDLSKLPLRVHVTTDGLEQSVPDVNAAERLAGFRPYLPSPGGLGATPGISVSGPIDIDQTIHVRDIESALDKVGASDVQIPFAWEGAQLHIHIGPVIAANYPDRTQILQTRLIDMSVPPDFPLERFTEVAFRSIGVPLWEARAIAREFAADPAWLLDFPSDEKVNIQEVILQTGPALLIEDLDNHGNVERATVFRSTSERIYSVSSESRELSIKTIDTLP